MSHPAEEQIRDAEACITFQHLWQRDPLIQRRPDQRDWRLYWRCDRCASERYILCDIYGRYLVRGFRYSYSEAFKRARRATPRDGFTFKEAMRAQYLRSWRRSEQRNVVPIRKRA